MASLHSEAPVSQPVWARDVPEEGQCGGGGGGGGLPIALEGTGPGGTRETL